jgi:hypothetical protein
MGNAATIKMVMYKWALELEYNTVNLTLMPI